MLKNYSVFSGFDLIGRLSAENESEAYVMAFRKFGAQYGKHIRVEDESFGDE